MYAARISDALRGAIDTRKLAEAWAALHPGAFTESDSDSGIKTGIKSGTKSGVAKAVNPALAAFLARADAPPEMAADDRVVFKDADAGPKVPGLAGSGTRS